MNFQRTKSSAFTLIELLVVIAIIGMLAALLLPVLNRAKQRAQMVTDLDNTRQILVGAHLYAGDFEDYLPSPGWQLPSPCWAYGASLPYSFGGTVASYNTVYTKQLDAVSSGQLFPYIKTAKLLMCPADKVNSLFYEREMYISSYVWNGALSGYDLKTNATHKLAQFQPDYVLQWESDETSPISLNDGGNYPNEGFTRRHGGSPDGDPTHDAGSKVTVGMFDASASRTPTLQLYRLCGPIESSPTGPPAGMQGLPNVLWCNPNMPNGGPGTF